ncbi:MAG: transcriptional regulator [Erysipelotrichia bacterium]|nr:transcriptional regulator [Erysipelotrichia bacterium]
MDAEFSVAVHALIYLLHTGKITSSEELADNICTNPARVRKIMSKLKRTGYVTATKGQSSGYLVDEKIRDLSLKQILAAIEEQPVREKWHSGDVDRNCQVSSGMGTVMDQVYAEMNDACMNCLDAITIGSIFQNIFQK